MAGMVKPVSLRLEDADIRKVRPCVYLVRAASATLRSFVTGATPANAVKAMFGNDVVTDLILRAPTAPAAISGTAGWAQSLAGVAIYDLIQSIVSLSAAANIIDRSLKLNMDGIAEYRVPGRVLNAAAAGQWVGEGLAAPIRALSFANDAILRPRKLQVLTTYSEELAAHSNIEERPTRRKSRVESGGAPRIVLELSGAISPLREVARTCGKQKAPPRRGRHVGAGPVPKVVPLRG